VRLSLAPAGSPRGLLDGAWWPRSRDLLRELPALIDLLDVRWGRITRVTVNPAHWPVIPRKVPLAKHTVHIGWFAAEQDPHKLILLSYTLGRWDLLVIPPETDADSAARLMSAASVSGLLTASALMAREGVTGTATVATTNAPAQAETGERWETEGGAAPVATGPAGPTD
jgi:hypothetical protein